MAAEKGSGKLLLVSDWEQLLQDFRTSHDLQHKWLTSWPGLTIIDQALQSITKKESPLKPQLLNFLEENAELLVGSDSVAGVSMLVESLRNILPAPVDGSLITHTLKEQMMVMVTTVAITVDAIHTATPQLEMLTEILLGFISRTNYAADRHVRATACECLRELELAHPCLLHACVGHVFALCQSERTHAGQSYKLLLTVILHNMACHMYTIKSRSSGAQPFLSITIPLVPFSVPPFLAASSPRQESLSVPAKELTAGSLKEFKRAVAYLLQRPDLLTEFGMLEFVARFINIARALNLHGSLLKPQFSSLVYTFSPVLCHVVLLIYSQFMDAFEGDEDVILKRLFYLCRETHQPLPVRLLGVHWLLGVENLQKDKHSVIAPLASGLYPLVFDPLSLKAAKLVALAHCAASLASSSSPLVSKSPPLTPNSQPKLKPKTSSSPGNRRVGLYKVLALGDSPVDPASRILDEGLLCVSAFTWLPSSSTETYTTFHALHKFLTAAIPHQNQSSALEVAAFIDSSLFKTIQLILVKMALKLRYLVPQILALLDRLMECNTHQSLGERLLRTFNEDLLPELEPNCNLPAYFPLIERLAENVDIPPVGLLGLLTIYVRKRVEEHKGDGGLKLWLRGSQVLGICRTVLMHHKSSRIFQSLSNLLSLMCLFFPDLEVRDTARLYLRMLISVPGNRIQEMLSYGDERVEEVNAPQYTNVSSLLHSPSAAGSQPRQPLLLVGAYIRLTRENSLLVRHSWSLVLYNTFQTGVDGGYKDVGLVGRFSEVVVEEVSEHPKEEMKLLKYGTDQEKGGSSTKGVIIIDNPSSSFEHREGPHSEPVRRVMDARTSEILGILRQHFEEIPDFRNGLGVKINIRCQLRFMGETLQRMRAEADGISDSEDLVDVYSGNLEAWPAIYAVVISFTSTGLYGAIPSVHVPFLLSEAPERKLETVIIELEPRQPVPTLVDAKIIFSDEDGTSVSGQLDSIPVGIEDLFLRAPVPSEGGGLGPWGLEESTKGALGSFLVLIFLPPRYHLLLKMEVSDWSTLVRIRTDHWPCLAHVDEFLEALIMSR
ncbi:unnamed protein product [Sphagnum compactum]